MEQVRDRITNKIRDAREGDVILSRDGVTRYRIGKGGQRTKLQPQKAAPAAQDALRTTIGSRRGPNHGSRRARGSAGR